MNNHTHFNRIIDFLIKNFSKLEAQIFEESELSNLSMKQLVYLETIARMDQPTFSDLARTLHVSKPSVTAIYNKLSEKGYVEKIQSEEDRRSFYIILTSKGKTMQSIHDDLHRKIAEHIANALTDEEVIQLQIILEKIIKRI